MKNTLLLWSTVLGMSLTVPAQVRLDACGMASDEPARIVSVPLSSGSARSAMSSITVIHTIPSPISMPTDLAFDGLHLWMGGFAEFRLFQISMVDGSIIKSIPTNINRPYGLEFMNGHLWVSDAEKKIIQQVDTANGNVIDSFSTPAVAATSYPTGLAWDGQYLWNNDILGTGLSPIDSTFKITTAGQIMESHPAFGTGVSGLAWDGQYLWSTSNTNLKIYKIDISSFTPLDSVDAPGGLYPNGLAFDGQYLWVASNDADSLYQFSVDGLSVGQTQHTSMNAPDYSIYPNPSGDKLTITSSAGEAGSAYSVTDATGRPVMSGTLHDKTTVVDISCLASGIYWLQVAEKRKQSFHLIKK